LTYSATATAVAPCGAIIIIMITNEKLKVMLSRNAAGALYKIIRREKLVNVSQNYGRIEMSLAGV